MPAHPTLVDLLLSMFSADELRRFVRWGPDGERLSNELPAGGASAATLASQVVEVWVRHEFVNDALFDRLVAERSRRKPQIDEVRRACLTAPVVGPAPRPVVASAPASVDIEYLIAVALPLEQAAVASLLTETGERTLPDGTVVGLYSLAGARTLQIGLVTTGMGNENAALVVSSALHELKPRAVVFVGIAGGLKPKDSGLGDVVVATKVYGFEFGKGVAGGFQPRAEIANTAYRFQQRAQYEAGRPRWRQRLGGTAQPKVFVKPIAAGSVRVASEKSEAAKRLAAYYGDAYAVDMESFGALKALDQQRVEGVIVRGISDFVATVIGDADADVAARNAAAFTLEMLANLG